MTAIKIDTENNVSVVELGASVYEELDRLLGGWPERVCPRRLPPPYCMLVDESGILKDLPNNMIGSYLYQTDLHGYPIVGDIYIMREEGTKSNIHVTGLTDDEVDWLLPSFVNMVKKVKERTK